MDLFYLDLSARGLLVASLCVCLSFRRRYFYNKIRNYEALELPSRTKIPLFNSGKIFFVTVWIFYDSQQEGEKSKSSRARSSFLIPERRHSHQRPHQFGPGRSLRFEPATTGSISAVTSCAPSTLPPTPAAARRRQETTTEEVSGTS